MADAQTVKHDFARYADLIAPMIASVSAPDTSVEAGEVIQVDRGAVYARAMVDLTHPVSTWVDRLIAAARAGTVATATIADGAAHQRPAYRGLLIYAWLRAYGLLYETLPRSEFGQWEEALRGWCDLLEASLTQIAWLESHMPASRGAAASAAVWNALALHAAGKIFVRDAWTDLAADTFGKLVRGQTAAGAFLQSGPSDNPETHWYHELVLLHAAGSYAVQAEDRTVARAVRRATEFHQSQTQPDHATSQPWALFPFIWNPTTRPLADQILHATQVQHPAGLDGLSLMLLADCLYCLRLFL